MWIDDYGSFLPENIPYRDISPEDQVAQLKKQMAQQKRQQLFEEISEIIYDVLSVYPDTPNSKLEEDMCILQTRQVRFVTTTSLRNTE